MPSHSRQTGQHRSAFSLRFVAVVCVAALVALALLCSGCAPTSSNSSNTHEAGSFADGVEDSPSSNSNSETAAEDFAPDADIANNPESNTMARRSFGTSAAEVSPMVKAQVEGFLSSDVLCAAKHFPGIGGAEGDSHHESIYSQKTVDQMASEELLPFQAAMEANVPFIMVGHLSTPAITGTDAPASLSSEIATGVLRECLGYEGIVITDSLSMAAASELYPPSKIAVAALEAGVDMMLMPTDLPAALEGVVDAVESGTLTEERLDESLMRIVRAKLAWEDGSLAA